MSNASCFMARTAVAAPSDHVVTANPSNSPVDQLHTFTTSPSCSSPPSTSTLFYFLLYRTWHGKWGWGQHLHQATSFVDLITSLPSLQFISTSILNDHGGSEAEMARALRKGTRGAGEGQVMVFDVVKGRGRVMETTLEMMMPCVVWGAYYGAKDGVMQWKRIDDEQAMSAWISDNVKVRSEDESMLHLCQRLVKGSQAVNLHVMYGVESV